MPVTATDPMAFGSALDSPPTKAFAITPSDTDELTYVVRGIYVGGAGNLKVMFRDDTVAVTFVGLTAGSTVAGRIKQVLSTGTTATNLIGAY